MHIKDNHTSQDEYDYYTFQDTKDNDGNPPEEWNLKYFE